MQGSPCACIFMNCANIPSIENSPFGGWNNMEIMWELELLFFSEFPTYFVTKVTIHVFWVQNVHIESILT